MSILRAFKRRSSSSRSSSSSKLDTDSTYDDEARRLFAALNLPVAKGARRTAYDDLNAVWQHPTTGARVFIGNQTAASSKTMLQAHGISCVVNCTNDIRNYHEKDSAFAYYRFRIASWYSFSLIQEPNGAHLFFAPIFEWIDNMLAERRSVLIHCLAGAHRAGTTGTTFVMHACKLSLKEALTIVKHIRPVVQPIGTLGQLARKYDKECQTLMAANPTSLPMSSKRSSTSKVEEEGRARESSGAGASATEVDTRERVET
jgi:hypothetical protein